MDLENHIRLGGGSIRLGAGAGAWAAVGIIGLAALWGFAYGVGLAPWLGFEQRTVRNLAIGPLTHAGQSSAGFDVGLKTFLFLEGQEVFVDYDVDIRRGSLLVRVFDETRFEPILHTHIVESGTGRISVRIPRTGLYEITLEPSTLKGPGTGYDLTYDATWGAHW
jgi:hypothetical protein